MQKNVGRTDKWLRIILGVVIAGVGYYMQNWVLGIIGVIIFGTGIFNWCLLYRIFGISTCKTEAIEKNINTSTDTDNNEKVG